jgi:XRE family aerobic/anaerobic benzoate catabolism transcriptional regulator
VADRVFAAHPRESEEDAAFLSRLGERLRLLRAQRGMTRRALSQQSRVSERYIAQMEAGSGNVSILLLRALARALAVPTTDLLADKPVDALLLERLLERLTPVQLEAARALLMEHFAAPKVGLRRQRLALIGLRGAGKSTLGGMLAERLGYRFHELDREIEREAGVELREIFELHGQAGFRRLEQRVLERLVAEPPGMVVATGGSIVAEPATFELLLRACLTIWIRASPQEHMQRVIEQGDLRPMRDNKQSMADLRAILASRESLYARADLTLDTSGKGLEESFAELVALLS